jgi:sugar phosphate isomerase/epimerase
MFIHVKDAKYLKDYKIWLRFNDGAEGVIDLEKELWGEVFEPLKDINNFKNFILNADSETLEWPLTGADMAPEFLRENIKNV